MLEIVEASGGRVVTVGEEAIAASRVALARRGLDVEPTAAAGHAGLLAGRSAGDGLTVLALTGAGLKASPAAAS
jgi:threonine synthase